MNTAYTRWGLPDIDLKDMPKCKVDENYEMCCPFCGEKLNWDSEEEYMVNGKVYPISCNEYMCNYGDVDEHSWSEIHCCEKCGKESWFRDDCF